MIRTLSLSAVLLLFMPLEVRADFSFAVFGDMQAASCADNTLIIRQVQSIAASGASFFIATGDLIAGDSSTSCFAHNGSCPNAGSTGSVKANLAPLIRTPPPNLASSLFLAIGNHDDGWGDKWYPDPCGDGICDFINPSYVNHPDTLDVPGYAHQLLHHGDICSKDSGSSGYSEDFFYSFVYQNCYFIVLRMNQDSWGMLSCNNLPSQYGSCIDYCSDTTLLLDPARNRNCFNVFQYDWLRTELDKAKSYKHIFVFAHAPVLTSSTNHPATSGADKFRALFEQYNVLAYFNGHDHAYERTFPVRGNTIDSTGVVYITDGPAGGGEEEPITGAWFTGASYMNWTTYTNQTQMSGYMLVTVKDDGNVVGKRLGIDNSLQDSFTLGTVIPETPDSVNVQILASAGGTVTPNISQRVKKGDTLQLHASPALNYSFVKWTVTAGITAIGADTIAKFAVTQDGSISAGFQRILDTLTIVAGAHGAVSPSGQLTQGQGLQSVLHANPDPGYSFLKWVVVKGDSVTISTINKDSTLVAMNHGSVTIEAEFGSNTYPLVTVYQSELNRTPDTVAVQFNDTVHITAPSVTGYHFVNWKVVQGKVTIADTTKASSTLIVSDTVPRIEPLYSSSAVALVTVYQSDLHRPSDTVIVKINDTVQIIAPNIPGYHFVNWKVVQGKITIADTTKDSSTAIILDTLPVISPLFSRILYKLTINKTPGGKVFPDSDTTVSDGDSVQLTAVPDIEYYFEKWQIQSGDALLADSAAVKTILFIKGNVTILATFQKSTSVRNAIPSHFGLRNLSAKRSMAGFYLDVPSVPGKSSVRVLLELLNLKAQRVEILADRDFEPGSHLIYFDRSRLSSGTYLIRMTSWNYSHVEKIQCGK